MDPSIIAAILSLIGSASVEWLKKKETAKEVEEKIDTAKRKYQAQASQLSSEVESKLNTLLGDLSKIQTKIRLYVPDKLTHDRLLNILSDHFSQAYEAKTEQDIKLVDLSLEPVRKEAEEYEQTFNNRKLARRLAFIVPLAVLIGIGVLLGIGSRLFELNFNTFIPIIQVPLPVLLWSIIGSCVAILYRFNKSGDAELEDPLRWLFTRPLTGIIMGIVSYYVVLAGLLAIAPKDMSSLASTTPPMGAIVILWLLPFISSFSDRFADGVLKALVGRFGGDTKEDFNSPEVKLISSYLRSLVNESLNAPSGTGNHVPKPQLPQTQASIQTEILAQENDVLPDAQQTDNEQTNPFEQVERQDGLLSFQYKEK